MRPTTLRLTVLRQTVAVLVGCAALAVAAPVVHADPPRWEQPIRKGIVEQDAEIARSSAKAVWTRLESQASRNRDDLLILYFLARAYGKGDRRADAVTAYGETLAIEPGCWFAWRDRGVLKIFGKDLRGAEADLRQAVRLRPDYVDALQPLGMLLIEQKRYFEGITVLSTLLNYEPGLDIMRFQVAEAYFAAGRPSEALQTLEQLLGLPRNTSDPALAATLLNSKARYLIALGEIPKAQAICKDLTKRNPNDPRPIHTWLEGAIRGKSLDADEGIWFLERLKRLSRSKEAQDGIDRQIADLRRQAAAAAAAAARPKDASGPPTADDIARALRAPDAKVRESAMLYLLGGVSDTFSINGQLTVALVERLDAKGHEPSPIVRALAIHVLGQYGTPEFASVLRPSLRDEDPNVRRKAADALGRLKNPLAVAALWRYATGADLDLAVSARLAIYDIAKVPVPEAAESSEAQAAAFKAWWESTAARDVKSAAIAAVMTSDDRVLDELLFPFAYLDADEVISMSAYKALNSLVELSKKSEAPRAIWMRTLPILGSAPNADPNASVDPTARPLAPGKPYHNDALAAWWMRRP